MKKQNFLSLLYQLASPVLLMLLGVLLVLNPDFASAMVVRVLGWFLTLAGIGFGILAVADRRGAVGKGITAVALVCVGGYLLTHPLLLAASVGAMLGALIALRGLRDLFLSRRQGHGQILSLITTAVGILLVVLPMTTSRLVFRLCGVVILGIGAARLLDRLKNRPYLEEGDDPNIIDAL